MRKLLILATLLLSACAQPVFDPSGVDPGITPARVARQPGPVQGRRVIWGGEIVASRNLAETTELVVLARPLNRAQRPQAGGPQMGRFIVHYPGYLETVVYQPGRLVTVEGRVVGRETRRVGEADYTYPQVGADSVYLWPEGQERDRVRVGVGVGIGIHL